MTINDRVIEMRQALGLSQAAIATRLDISQAAVNKLEHGGGVSDRNVRALVTMFGVNENWLRTGEGEMFMDKQARAEEELRTKYQLTDAEARALATFLTAAPSDRARIFDGLTAIARWLAE